MSNNHRFSGRVAFITGAASGIGRATAIAFATEGARIAILDRTEDALSETADAVRNAGAEVLVIACDVSKPDQVEAAVVRVVETFGQPCAATLGEDQSKGPTDAYYPRHERFDG